MGTNCSRVKHSGGDDARQLTVHLGHESMYGLCVAFEDDTHECLNVPETQEDLAALLAELGSFETGMRLQRTLTHAIHCKQDLAMAAASTEAHAKWLRAHPPQKPRNTGVWPF